MQASVTKMMDWILGTLNDSLSPAGLFYAQISAAQTN